MKVWDIWTKEVKWKWKNDPFGLIRYVPGGLRMGKENLKMSLCLLSFFHSILISSSRVLVITSLSTTLRRFYWPLFPFLIATAIWFTKHLFHIIIKQKDATKTNLFHSFPYLYKNGKLICFLFYINVTLFPTLCHTILTILLRHIKKEKNINYPSYNNISWVNKCKIKKKYLAQHKLIWAQLTGEKNQINLTKFLKRVICEL